MIKGILYNSGPREEPKPRPDTLLFKCPGCKQNHAVFISKTGYPNPGDPYKVSWINVWLYHFTSGIEIEIHPSWDNSMNCGWHSPNPWLVRVVDHVEGDDDNESAWIEME